MDFSINNDNIFRKMILKIDEKKQYFEFKRSIYDGSFEAKSLNISLPRDFDRKLQTKLGWGKIAVDTLCNDLNFDYFKNDDLGFTKLFSYGGGFEAINSAIKNSMLTGCSFISVLIGENDKPVFTVYDSSEATALYNSKNGFYAGLVENGVVEKNGFKTVEDYLLFLKGKVIKVSKSGEVLEVVDTGSNDILFVPFIFEKDPANRPFGYSRFNKSFVNNLESGLRSKKLIEIGNDISLAARNILMTNAEPGELGLDNAKVDLTTMMTVFSPNADLPRLDQIASPKTEEIQNTLSVIANDAAVSVGLNATDFGYQPSNGSYSAEVLEKMEKSYVDLVKKSKQGFGESIKTLALRTMSLLSQQYDPNWEKIEPVFLKNVSLSKFGAVADGLNKLQIVAPDFDFSSFIEEEVVGTSRRSEFLNIDLPDFNNARNNSSNYSNLFDDYDKTL